MAHFYDHEVVRRTPDDYVEAVFAPSTILHAWQSSMFAHELLDSSGHVKNETELNETTLGKFLEARDALKRNEQVAKPIIGIGIMDTIEIGLGREIIAAATLIGLPTIPVHMRKAQAKEIQKMLAKRS